MQSRLAFTAWHILINAVKIYKPTRYIKQEALVVLSTVVELNIQLCAAELVCQLFSSTTFASEFPQDVEGYTRVTVKK